MRCVSPIVLAALVAPAQADDGIYFAEAIGVGQARGELAATVGNAIQSRLALGARMKWLAVEGWIMANMQTDREGAWRGLAGGEPAAGRADLEHYGFSVKAIAPLHRAPQSRLEGYVRVGPSIVTGTGMLDAYRGYGAGASAGLQVTGQVRALGFLWAGFFFMNKGPKVTGALFLDTGWDWVRLSSPDSDTIRARIGHVTVGFAVGSAF
jgi:hypothetical protein